MNRILSILMNSRWESDLSPAITVITPVYNRKGTLERALNSVTKQTFPNYEYIIVDDGSTDDIDGIITGFMDQAMFPVMY